MSNKMNTQTAIISKAALAEYLGADGSDALTGETIKEYMEEWCAARIDTEEEDEMMVVTVMEAPKQKAKVDWEAVVALIKRANQFQPEVKPPVKPAPEPDLDAAILLFLKGVPASTVKAVAKALGKEKKAINSRLYKMKDKSVAQVGMEGSAPRWAVV